MKITEAFKVGVKSVLTDMAIDNELDGDISQIDIDEVFEKATEAVKEHPTYKRSHEVEILGDFVSPVDTTLEETYDVLVKAKADGKGDDPADYYIMMVERYEYDFTVSELLDEVSI